MSKNSNKIINRIIKSSELAIKATPIIKIIEATVSMVVAAKILEYRFLSLKIAIIPKIMNIHDKNINA